MAAHYCLMCVCGFITDNAQLRNWRSYLDFEAANGGELRTIFLYERCVIACAQYEEFWLKVGLPTPPPPILLLQEGFYQLASW